jgi:nicotinate-nucleotide adenylyltransferase
VLAQEAARQLDLDEVLLVPTGSAPHKRIEPEPGAEVRLEMTRLAAAGDEVLSASDVEVAADGPSYTFRTLERLSASRPDDEVYFLMGADVAAQLESWKRPERVLEVARLGLARRGGSALDEARAALGRLGFPERAEVVEMPTLDVSSTEIRRRIAAGIRVRYLVPDAVIELIAARGLYREAVTA